MSHFHSWTDIFLPILYRLLLLISVVGGVWIVLLKSRWGKRRQTYRIAPRPGQLRQEILAGLKVFISDSIFGLACLAFGLFQLGPPSFGATLFTFVFLFVWFEIWFYGIHRLLHTEWFYFLHAPHHIAHVPNPISAISFSVTEACLMAVGKVLIPLLLFPYLPLNWLGLTLYLNFNLLFNVYGHSNIELYPSAFVRSRLGQVIATSSFHAIHHARQRGHFGLFTQTMDKTFGTYFEDYPRIHGRAVQGAGLEETGEILS